jgi:integrase/recombinase XerD
MKSNVGNLWSTIELYLEQRATSTRHTYQSIIREWAEYLGSTYQGGWLSERRLLHAKTKHAINFTSHIKQRPGAPARNNGRSCRPTDNTIARKLDVLRNLYDHLMQLEIASHNPFAKVQFKRERSDPTKRPTELIPFSKVQEILTLPDPRSKEGRRDRAILAVMFSAGLRRSEVCKLKLADVAETQGGVVYLQIVAAKGNKDRRQALPQWAAVAVHTLLEQRQAEGATSLDYLFTTYYGEGCTDPSNRVMNTGTLYKLFKGYCKRANLGSQYTPHSARATCITKLLSDGFSHWEVQQVSGHSSIQMVERYDKRMLSLDRSPTLSLNYDVKTKENPEK